MAAVHIAVPPFLIFLPYSIVQTAAIYNIFGRFAAVPFVSWILSLTDNLSGIYPLYAAIAFRYYVITSKFLKASVAKSEEAKSKPQRFAPLGLWWKRVDSNHRSQ